MSQKSMNYWSCKKLYFYWRIQRK